MTSHAEFQINNYITGNILEPLEEIANNNINILFPHFDTILKVNTHKKYDNIISKIIDKKDNLTNEQLAHIMGQGANADKLIQKIGITQQIIDLACIELSYNGLDYLFNNKVIPTTHMFQLLFTKQNVGHNFIKAINIFIQYDYQISYDDFLLITKNEIIFEHHIPNDFLTDEFFTLCHDYKFYPPYYRATIKHLQYAAKYLTNYSKVVDYKKMVYKSNNNPDIQCLINACDSALISGLNFLTKTCNIKPNNDCLKAVLSNGAKQRTYIIEKYIEHHPNQ